MLSISYIKCTPKSHIVGVAKEQSSFNQLPLTRLCIKKIGYPYDKSSFTLATAVVRLQIFAVVEPKSARVTLASNCVRLQAHKPKNPLNQITNSIDQWFSNFCGFWPTSINSQHQWPPAQQFWVALRLAGTTISMGERFYSWSIL